MHMRRKYGAQEGKTNNIYEITNRMRERECGEKVCGKKERERKREREGERERERGRKRRRERERREIHISSKINILTELLLYYLHMITFLSPSEKKDY